MDTDVSRQSILWYFSAYYCHEVLYVIRRYKWISVVMVVGFLFLVSFSLVLTKKPGFGFTTYITNKLKKTTMALNHSRCARLWRKIRVSLIRVNAREFCVYDIGTVLGSVRPSGSDRRSVIPNPNPNPNPSRPEPINFSFYFLLSFRSPIWTYNYPIYNQYCSCYEVVTIEYFLLCD